MNAALKLNTGGEFIKRVTILWCSEIRGAAEPSEPHLALMVKLDWPIENLIADSPEDHQEPPLHNSQSTPVSSKQIFKFDGFQSAAGDFRMIRFRYLWNEALKCIL